MVRTMDELSAQDVMVGQVWLRVTTERKAQKQYRVRAIDSNVARMEATDGSEARFVTVGKLLSCWHLSKEAN